MIKISLNDFKKNVGKINMSTRWDDKSWQKKLSERRKFNDKIFKKSSSILRKNIIQGIYFGHIYVFQMEKKRG